MPVVFVSAHYVARMIPWKKVLFSCCVFFSTLLLIEGVCRVAGFGAKKSIHEDIANWEREYDGEFFVYTPDKDLINRDGLRDYPHAIENTAKRPRIICLGDSVTYGYGLAPMQAYPLQLQQVLAPTKAEVFNVALPGWATRQQHIAWNRIARKYKPNLVILGICLNDVAEMQNNLAEPPAWLKWAYGNLNIVRALVRPDQAEIAQVEELFETPEPPHVTNAYRLFFDELDQLKKEILADGCGLVVIIFPFRLQLEEDAPPPIPQQRMMDHFNHTGTSASDLLSLFQENRPEEVFIDHDHLTAKACIRLAQALGGLITKPN
ncbi:MAG: lysophospholipase L1-like esterase [Kiritimatiellia bacterium]